MSWFTEVRKVALIACVTGTLGLISLAWGLIQTLKGPSSPGTAMSVALLVIAALTPVFYFALWLNEAPLNLPDTLRRVTLIACVPLAILFAIGLLGWLDALSSNGLPEPSIFLTQCVDQASILSYLLLLLALYRAPMVEGAAPVSGLLEVVSRVAVIVSGLWLVVNLLQTGAVPYAVWVDRAAIQNAQGGQIAKLILTGPMRRLVGSFCIFVAPYVVSFSMRRVVAHQDPEVEVRT